jgi:UDP-N-acetylmuramyl-tripeptide synthetase/UDP-N-acetylmuramoyl-tripeptide--D-alanyl-D-alanine ligase
MWPLSTIELSHACGSSDAPSIDVSIAGVCFGETPPARDELFVALREGDFDGHSLVVESLEAGAPFALVSADWEDLASLDPALRARCIVVPDSLVAFRKLAAFMRARFAFPVIAVGGSNGKTTTKEMLAALLGGPGRRISKTPDSRNGWTGIPITLCDRAHERSNPPQALVVEIGIDAVGAMANHVGVVAPDVCVISALGPEHLQGLHAVDTAVREELVLFEKAPTAAKRIFQANDPHVRRTVATAREGDVIVCRASDATSIDTHGLALLAYDVAIAAPSSVAVHVTWKPTSGDGWNGRFDVPMSGAHNGDNFAASLAVACALGRTHEEIAAAWTAFKPPSMRCETRTLPNGALLIDDAYNASPESMRAALALLDSPGFREREKVLVLGDMLDLGESTARFHADLSPPLTELANKGARIFLYGDAMTAVHRAVESKHLPSDADPRSFLDDPCIQSKNAVILVKGSRGTHLERVVHALTSTSTSTSTLSSYVGLFASACVTGTNGKTTTTSLICEIVKAANETPARVTTLGSWVGDDLVSRELGGDEFLLTLERAKQRGVKTLAIETTSHALAQGFARTFPPKVAVFTNLSRDHLDYHGTPEHYLAAKAQLFMALPDDGVAILNLGDPSSALLDEVTPKNVRRLGYCAGTPDPECAAIPLVAHATSISIDDEGTHAILADSEFARGLCVRATNREGGELRLDLALVGSMHVENALAAALAGHALGYSFDVVRAAVSRFTGVPGRFQVVGRRPTIVVDYAHTPDALSRTLSLARTLVQKKSGRVVVVFGCGGDRDPGKRSDMGAVASIGADVVFLTNDNPRTEDPEKIADAVEAGRQEARPSFRRILDRGKAIDQAVELAKHDDIVVIAGKGHETTQIIGDRELPFDDVSVAQTARARRGDDSR